MRTARQRFGETMGFGRPDRVPWLEEGQRDDVLAAWREQGMAPGKELSDVFEYDRRQRVEVDLSPRPAVKRFPSSRGDLKALAAAFDPNDPKRFPADWPQRVEQWKASGDILELALHWGLFLSLGVGDWASLEPVLYLLADEPALARGAMEIYSAFACSMAQRVLRDIGPDVVSFYEPIADNHGPLVSPRMYRQLVLDTYRPIVQTVRGLGVQTILYGSYANARLLLEEVVAAGFNTLWAIEVEPHAMDYLDIRRQFGRDLRLIGGIDLDCLCQGERAIESEMRRVVPPLLEQGGYIPLADGRVRANMPFAAYRCYRRLLEELTGSTSRTRP